MIRINGLILVFALFIAGCKTALPPAQNTLNTESQAFVYPTQAITDTLPWFLKKTENKAVQSIYSLNHNRPIWCDTTQIKQGISILKLSVNHGLNPSDYKVDWLDSTFSQVLQSPYRAILMLELELQLTKSFKLLGQHLSHGKLNPPQFHTDWTFAPRPAITDSMLLVSLTPRSIAEFEPRFEPRIDAYSALKKELSLWLNRTEPLKKVNYPDYTPKLNDTGQVIATLKTALLQFIPFKMGNRNTFDTALFNTIKQYQHEQGLLPDGLPGRQTYNCLNRDKEYYINQLKVNLERLRWYPRTTFSNGILVNIAGFNLKYHEKGKLVFDSKVIVGDLKNRTPVLASTIDYLVFNPCWTVPNSIAVKKILPKLQTDSTYLQRNNMFIGIDGEEVDASEIDFSQFTADNFPYKIYQRTGAENALGQVKFMFDNKHSIYLHDTPNKTLFYQQNKALSHGCVRVQNALPLAELMLQIDQNPNSVKYYLKFGYPVKMYLKKRVPINLAYLTCFPDSLGRVIFYPDLYHLDEPVLNQLK